MSDKLRIGAISEEPTAAEAVEEPEVMSFVPPEFSGASTSTSTVSAGEPTSPTPATIADGDINPDDEVYSGGPTKAEIDAWKQEFGEVYVTTIGVDQNYIWRVLNRFEYRRLIKNLEQQVASGQMTEVEANLNNEELVTEMVLLYPKLNKAQLAGSLAGVASIISQQAMEASGFIATDVRQL